MPTAAKTTTSVSATASVPAAPVATVDATAHLSLDDLIGGYNAVLSGFDEIPEDLGTDTEGAEDDLIAALRSFAAWVGFDGYNPDEVKTFSATPKKEGGYYFGCFRLVPSTDGSGGTSLLWGGHEIPMTRTIGNFVGDWLAKPSQEKDPKNPEKTVWKLTVSAPAFDLSFRPRLVDELAYEDLNITSWASLAKILAVSSNRRALNELAGQSFAIAALVELRSKADKPYGVFDIQHEDGRQESVYAPPLDQLTGIAYPATGVVDADGERLLVSDANGKTFDIAVPRMGKFTSLAKMPNGEYTVIATYEETSDKFGVQTKVDALDAAGNCWKLGLNATLKRQLKYLPEPTKQTPLILHVDGRSVESSGRRVMIDGEVWTMDLETKEVKANGIIQKTDGKVYVDARLTQPVTEARPKTKLEELAAKAKARKAGNASANAKTEPVSAFV